MVLSRDDGSRRAPLMLLTPKPLSAYGRAVNNFVDLNLGMVTSSS